MARAQHPAAQAPAGTSPQVDPTLLERSLEKVLAVQRPAVVAHLRSVRLRHPDATPAQLAVILERRYLAAVTSGGAAVGATAVIPGITTGMTLALSGAETVGFMESTALFAQSLAELHGIHVDDPDRARGLVLTLMLGAEGVALLGQFGGQARGTGPTRSAYWGEMITQTLPKAAVGPAVDKLKSVFIKHFAARAGASWVGKALPFGIGAVVGGVGNNVLARRVVASSRLAFGPAPFVLRAELEPAPETLRLEHRAVAAARRAGDTATQVGRSATTAVRRVLPGRRRSTDAVEPGESAAPARPGDPAA